MEDQKYWLVREPNNQIYAWFKATEAEAAKKYPKHVLRLEEISASVFLKCAAGRFRAALPARESRAAKEDVE